MLIKASRYNGNKDDATRLIIDITFYYFTLKQFIH